jgi:hypothetical protein
MHRATQDDKLLLLVFGATPASGEAALPTVATDSLPDAWKADTISLSASIVDSNCTSVSKHLARNYEEKGTWQQIQHGVKTYVSPHQVHSMVQAAT